MDSNDLGMWEKITSFFNLSTLSIPSIRLTDIIDMAIVAIVIYIILCWVKETRAWTLVKGLLIIGIVSLVSYKFHFYTLSWIIEKTFSVGVIAIVILFQPELRKALEQIGASGFKNIAGIIKSDEDTILTAESAEQIMEACIKMSDVRTGALIVIERDVPVGDFIKSGISIDGIISCQLLMNIFENKTPLHDGAVIIQNNKIKAATCILPVTQKQIGLELGTRHRAAVGASEVSDAYIIIVSEETGAISVAFEGRLKKNVSRKYLENILTSLTMDNRKPVGKMFNRGKLKNEEDN